MKIFEEAIKPFVVETKTYLRSLQDVKKCFDEISNQMKYEVESIQKLKYFSMRKLSANQLQKGSTAHSKTEMKKMKLVLGLVNL